MLVIRTEQVDALREAALGDFETGMLAHLRDFSPPLFETAGKARLRQAIRLGVKRARTYGFTFRGPVRLYLELMLLFGSHFDTDPQYPWAAEILNNQSAALQMRRADRLYEKTLDYREHVNGPADAHAIAAFKKLSNLAKTPVSIDFQALTPFMLGEIRRIYPQKALYVGSEGLTALIREGSETAHRHHLTTIRGTILLIMLMLGFGHGCADDPLYPWISRALKDKAFVEPEARANHLERKALTWLEHALVYIEKETPP